MHIHFQHTFCTIAHQSQMICMMQSNTLLQLELDLDEMIYHLISSKSHKSVKNNQNPELIGGIFFMEFEQEIGDWCVIPRNPAHNAHPFQNQPKSTAHRGYFFPTKFLVCAWFRAFSGSLRESCAKSCVLCDTMHIHLPSKSCVWQHSCRKSQAICGLGKAEVAVLLCVEVNLNLKSRTCVYVCVCICVSRLCTSQVKMMGSHSRFKMYIYTQEVYDVWAPIPQTLTTHNTARHIFVRHTTNSTAQHDVSNTHIDTSRAARRIQDANLTHLRQVVGEMDAIDAIKRTNWSWYAEKNTPYAAGFGR